MAEKSEERLALEARADALGITHRANWHDETIAEKIAEAEAAQAASGQASASGEGASAPDNGGEGGGKTAPTQPEPGAEGALIVIGPKKGRWRAGRHFTREPSIILVSDLAEGEREMIEGDPMLTVEFLLPED